MSGDFRQGGRTFTGLPPRKKFGFVVRLENGRPYLLPPMYPGKKTPAELRMQAEARRV